jgi:hypothetical protein
MFPHRLCPRYLVVGCHLDMVRAVVRFYSWVPQAKKSACGCSSAIEQHVANVFDPHHPLHSFQT